MKVGWLEKMNPWLSESGVLLVTDTNARSGPNASARRCPGLRRFAPRFRPMSAGLVFHHLKAPFPDVVRLAHGQLRAAKTATRGRKASVAFLDLTADGDAPPASRAPVTAADLDQQASRLTGIATVSRSHRETLVALERLAHVDPRTRGPAGSSETPIEALARRVADLGCAPIGEAVLGRPGAATRPRSRLTSAGDAQDQQNPPLIARIACRRVRRTAREP